MTLKFSEKAHRYWLDGKVIPGVTTLLGKGLPKPAIPYWAAKSVAEYVIQNPEGVENLRAMGEGPAIAALKQIPWEKRDQAAVRGTDVHALGERLIHGENVDVPEHLAGHVEGYAAFLDEWDIEPILTEKSCANRKWFYAGRFDAIVKLNGATCLLDLKTSKGVYGETSLQTAAYAKAEFYVTDENPNDEIPMPHIDRIAVAHVTESGTTLHDLGDIENSFRIFQHIQWTAKRVDEIKGLVSEALIKENAS